MTLQVTTDELPAEDEVQVAAAQGPDGVEAARLGLVVRDMNEERAGIGGRRRSGRRRERRLAGGACPAGGNSGRRPDSHAEQPEGRER